MPLKEKKEKEKPCDDKCHPRQQEESVESLMRTIAVCRSVGLEIINRTKTVTLRGFRSYCFSGKIVTTLPFEIGPDSKGICVFAKTPYSLRGSVGTVVCKADTFFLAITFSNPFDYILYKIEFALEIFTEQNHLGNLSDVFSRMLKSKPYCGSSLFQRAALGYEHETLEVSKGNVRVQAKMSNNQKAILKVQLEDMNPPPYNKDMSYSFSGQNVDPLPFEIGPNSKGVCTFAKTPYSLRGSVGIVVCKADTFFLAITFSNPYDYVLYKIEFALEIFTEENHLGNLSDVFSKMMKSKPYSSSSLFQRAMLESEHETLEVSKGSIRVQAKMSNCEKAILKVQVEDMDPPPYYKDM
ncbi:hypothetical protein CIB84_002900 [Bambusicola thoracicus]|uniref:Uncharacterized protein n=1 Tax=Bambusicola thoracicus TaxID=9083 RepID=A0A2P4TAF3_BAMTH|nr:hypothetical protein CIB84_002900 [Bambusicola thoracicus]